MHLNGKVRVSVDVVSGVVQSSVLVPLLFIWYTSELFYIVGNHMVGYAHNTTIYAVIPRLLSRPQVESLNRNLGSNPLLVFEVAHEANPKQMKSKVISRPRTYAPGYGDLTLGSTELEKIKSLRIHGVALYFI